MVLQIRIRSQKRRVPSRHNSKRYRNGIHRGNSSSHKKDELVQHHNYRFALLVFGPLLHFLHASDLLVIVADAVDAPASSIYKPACKNKGKGTKMKSYTNLVEWLSCFTSREGMQRGTRSRSFEL